MMWLFAVQALFVGNQACRPCHAEIFDAYSATPMARSSGRVTDDVAPGVFRHEPSGIEYRIERNGSVTLETGAARQQRTLEYFIGSGAAGRTYLYARRGFLFEAPVTWYSQRGAWDASPGFESDRDSRWSRPVEPSCLSCHASQLRAVSGTQNQYGAPPFTQGGVSCERCHGAGSLHVDAHGPMVNPAKLDAARRDSICMQCHLSGEARVSLAGRQMSDYRAGALLAEYVSYFVSESPSALKATSHVEKLQASRCKQASGDRLWCGTCHDPHRIPTAAARPSWYRNKCLTCHAAADCSRGDDCISCHMPKGRVVDGGHGVLTDHGIPRSAAAPRTGASGAWRLQAFRGFSADARSIGLAYAEVSRKTGDRRQAAEAERLLASAAPDPDVLAQLAYLRARGGQTERAAELYREALRLDPNSVIAMVNLGAILGTAGKLADAAALWREALRRNPCQTEASANLLRLYEARGEHASAEALRKSREFCSFP
jgi:tetratricopeptide (TPR) repeat protein